MQFSVQDNTMIHVIGLTFTLEKIQSHSIAWAAAGAFLCFGVDRLELKLDNILRYKRKLKEQQPWVNANARQQLSIIFSTQRYLIVEASGGLNRQWSLLSNNGELTIMDG